MTASLLAAGDGIRRRFRGERVAVGLVDGERTTVAAISQQASLDPGAPETRLLADALDEAVRRGEQLRFGIGPDKGAADGGAASAPTRSVRAETAPAHATLVAGRPGTAVVTTPLCHREKVIGALLIESASEVPWSRARLELLQQIADALAPMAFDRRAAERTLGRRAADAAREGFAALRAPRHLVAKCGVALLGLVLLGLAVVPFEQRVAAAAELVPLQLRTVTAPMDGYVARVAVAAGDTVREDQLLFELDTRELALERDRARGELADIAAELRAVRALGDRRQVAVLNARRDQARAELALVEQRIARATVTAPHDGRVLSGDLARLVGAPVERGQRLIELAPDGGWTVSLLVDERDIELLAVGQAGTLTLQARPGERLALELADIHPIAVAGDGRNRFRVDAELGRVPTDLLPGQTGVGRIRVGEASALHLITRRFTGWVRMALWEQFGR